MLFLLCCCSIDIKIPIHTMVWCLYAILAFCLKKNFFNILINSCMVYHLASIHRGPAVAWYNYYNFNYYNYYYILWCLA